MASKKFTQFDTANNTSETEISVGVKGTDNFKRANYLTATTNPTVSNDGTQGYTVGSLWFNVTDSLLYICKSSATGAAVWSVYRERPNKLFSANLTQTGTDAPTINVLYNDTGITWTGVYDAVGGYKLVPDVPPPDDTKVQVFCGYGTALTNAMRWRSGEVLIFVYDSGLNPVDGSLQNTPIHILIWP